MSALASSLVAACMTQSRTRLDHAFPQPQSQNRLNTECTMAPPLSAFQHDLIDAMIKQNLPNEIIAKEAECHERTVRRRLTKRCSTPTKMPRGRRRLITPYMEEILRDHLTRDSVMYRFEMADFLYDETGVEVSPFCLSRNIGWSRKVARRVAKQRNQELRDLYVYAQTFRV